MLGLITTRGLLMFRVLDNTLDWFGEMWASHKHQIDWGMQFAILIYAIIFGLFMALVISMLS